MDHEYHQPMVTRQMHPQAASPRGHRKRAGKVPEIKLEAKQADKALKRFLSGRMDQAVLALVRADYDPVKAIHDCRKSLKQVRTLLRIIKPQLGETASACGNICRETALALAQARDAHVMRQGWRAIVAEQAVAKELARKVEAALAGLDDDRERPRPDLFGLSVGLSLARDSVLESWSLENADKLYRKRLKKFQSRTRDAWQAAELNSESEQYHNARKAGKNWMYALRVVRDRWDKPTKRLHRELKRFTDALGNANDCALLEHWLGQTDVLAEHERLAALEAVLGHRGRWLAEARKHFPDK